MESTRGDQLGKAIKWSFSLHGAVAVFAIFKSLVFPSAPVMLAPSLRVDMVGLPDILKKDLSRVSKALPKQGLEEKLNEAAENVKRIKASAPPVEEVAKPDDMVLNPKKIAKKDLPTDDKKEKAAEKAEDKKREQKLQSALARIRALEKVKDESDEESDEAVIIRGNQASKGASLSGDAKESAQNGYFDIVRDRLVDFWSLPAWLSRQKLSAHVVIRIDPAGNIFATKIIKSSGNIQFDDAILATIRDAQPLPRPPKDLQNSLRDDGITVGFPL